MEDVSIFMEILSILQPNGTSYGHLVHCVVIWYIFTVLVCCTQKNMRTLVSSDVGGFLGWVGG
jgi:hypothetical protein